MDNFSDQMDRQQLLNEIKQGEQSILIEQKALNQAQSEANEQHAKYLTLKMENEDLYREIELEENGSVRYSNDRLNRHIDTLKVNIEAMCTSFQNVLDDHASAGKKEVELIRIWHKIIRDMPNEWFSQNDDVLQQMIAQMDDHLQSCKTGFDERRGEFSRLMEQERKEIMEWEKANRDVGRLITELKRIIATYKVMQSQYRLVQ